MEIHKKLAHLSPEEIQLLISKYQDKNENISVLIKEFKLDVKPSSLLACFPLTVHKSKQCMFCENIHLVSKVNARHSNNTVGKLYCPECGHKAEGLCNCEGCLVIRDYNNWQLEETKRALIGKYYDHKQEIFEVKDIDLKDAVYLLAIASHIVSEDFKFVEPFKHSSLSLAPGFDFQSQIVKHLYAEGFIKVSVDSALDAFAYDEKVTKIEGYYPTKVIWELLPGMCQKDKKSYLKTLKK